MLGRPAATRYPQPENRTSEDSTPHPPADRWIEAKPASRAIAASACLSFFLDITLLSPYGGDVLSSRPPQGCFAL